MKPLFDHEKLDVYCVELKFIAWIGDFSQDVSRSSSSELELVAVGSPLDFHGVEDRLKHPPWPPCDDFLTGKNASQQNRGDSAQPLHPGSHALATSAFGFKPGAERALLA
jgi:hypothetical protein